jgi:hypothetical protein
MARKIHTLKGLVVDEVSLVDRGANAGAVVVLAKRKEVDMTTLEDVIKERDAVLVDVAKHYTSEAGLAAFPDLTAADFTEAAKRLALADRRASESPEQAFVRCLKTTDTGRALRQAALWAPGPDHRATPPATPLQSDPAKAGPASQRIHDLAQTLLLNEAGSRSAGPINPLTRAGMLASAKTRIRAMHPAIANAEALEQRGA